MAAALADGRVRDVPGFGATTEARLAAELARRAAVEAEGDERVPIGRALPVAEEIARDLREAVPGAVVEVAGSLRRGRESVHDIDLVAGSDRPADLQDALAAHPAVERELSRGDASASVATHAGVRLELAVGPPESFGNLLQHATGSAAHNVRLRELAVRQGLSVSQHGVLGPDGRRAVHADEEGVYAALGLHPVPPELREDRGEIEAAREGPLPDLVERDDLRGDLHCHTRWSDGTRTVAQMVEAARARGYAYLAISDHSQSLAMAGGLDAERVRRQWEEIDAENARRDDIVVLKGTEMDILADGRLDFDDELLAGFDWVTASVHSGFGQDAARYTGAGARGRREPVRRRRRPPHRPHAGAARARAGRPGAGGRGGRRRGHLPGGERPAPAPRPRRRHGPPGPGRRRADHDRLGRPLRGRVRLHPLRPAGRPPRGRAAGGRRQRAALGRARGAAAGRGSPRAGARLSEPAAAGRRAPPPARRPPRRPPPAPRRAPRRSPPRARRRGRAPPASRSSRSARQASASVRSSPT